MGQIGEWERTTRATPTEPAPLFTPRKTEAPAREPVAVPARSVPQPLKRAA